MFRNLEGRTEHQGIGSWRFREDVCEWISWNDMRIWEYLCPLWIPIKDDLNNWVDKIIHFVTLRFFPQTLQYLHSRLIEKLMVAGMEIIHGLNMRFSSTKLIWLLPCWRSIWPYALNSTFLEPSIQYYTQQEETATWWQICYIALARSIPMTKEGIG